MSTHPLARLETMLLIAVGGFAGSNLRYFVELTVSPSLGATLFVNAVGSFALGVLLYEGLRAGEFSEQATLVFGTGFLSSFTTYSTFVLDAWTTPDVALAYIAASYVLGFGAVFAAGITVDAFGGV